MIQNIFVNEFRSIHSSHVPFEKFIDTLKLSAFVSQFAFDVTRSKNVL